MSCSHSACGAVSCPCEPQLPLFARASDFACVLPAAPHIVGVVAARGFRNCPGRSDWRRVARVPVVRQLRPILKCDLCKRSQSKIRARANPNCPYLPGLPISHACCPPPRTSLVLSQREDSETAQAARIGAGWREYRLFGSYGLSLNAIYASGVKVKLVEAVDSWVLRLWFAGSAGARPSAPPQAAPLQGALSPQAHTAAVRDVGWRNRKIKAVRYGRT